MPSASSIGGANPDSDGERLARHRLLGLLQPVHLGRDGVERAPPGRRCPPGSSANMADTLLSQRAVADGLARWRPGAAPTRGPGCAPPGRPTRPATASRVAEAVGDGGEHDVVERAAERALRTVLMSSTVVDGPGVAAVRADRAVEASTAGSGGRPRPSTHSPRATSPQLADGLARDPRAGAGGPELLVGAASQVGDGLGRPAPTVTGGGRRRPRSAVGGSRRRASVHDHGQQIGARHAVDHGVVRLRQHGPAAVLRDPRPSRSPTAAWSGRAAGP